MKLRQPWLVKAAAATAAGLLRAWLATLDYRYRPLGPDLDPRRPGLVGRYIYAMWHEYLLLPVGTYPRTDIHVLISRSEDGELVAELCRRLRVPVVRGSTSRGGAEAVRELVRAGGATHLALTPDGPRGPRRQVQQGLIYLASRTGLPVVPVGFGLDRPWRAASWDRFAIPRPWSRAACVTGAPITIATDAGRDEREAARLAVEQELKRVTHAAERLAATGHWMPDGESPLAG